MTSAFSLVHQRMTLTCCNSWKHPWGKTAGRYCSLKVGGDYSAITTQQCNYTLIVYGTFYWQHSRYTITCQESLQITKNEHHFPKNKISSPPPPTHTHTTYSIRLLSILTLRGCSGRCCLDHGLPLPPAMGLSSQTGSTPLSLWKRSHRSSSSSTLLDLASSIYVVV